MTDVHSELQRLRGLGVTLPKHPSAAIKSFYEGQQVNREIQTATTRDLAGLSAKLGRTVTSGNYADPEVQKIMQHNNAMTKAMGQSRALSSRMQRTAMTNNQTQMSPDTQVSMPRWYDPMEYWDLSGIPWNVADEGHRHKLHKWLRLYYATHYLLPQLVDIFTRFPLIGMEFKCKDPALVRFYEDLFFGQLKYEDFLVSLGREFWVVGEAFPLGSFNESAGVWEREELINPESVVVNTIPIIGATELKVAPPDHLKQLAQTQNPPKEWMLLKTQFPELIPYLLKGEHIPISPVMLTQVANKLNDWDDHGTPILLRGLRTLLHEEKLLASQDAIAERLYSPLLLAKLGIQDMGDGQPPWIPGPEELESVRDDLDVALSSDFRVMVHHFGLELESVFGREQMPRLGDDFDRIERRLMQIFGMNADLLSAGGGGQPYATSALQAEFLNQILKTFQKMLINHYEQRAYVIAEKHEHYDYEMRGTTKVELYEEIIEYDEDYNTFTVEKPKLLIPELRFETFDLRDEATERKFLQDLRTMGMPISNGTLAVGANWDPNEEIIQYNKDLKFQTITQQRAKMDTYTALTIQGLPIPADLKAEVESVLQPAGMPPMGGQQPPMPGGPGPSDQGGGGIMMPAPPQDLMGGAPGGAVPGGGPPAMDPMQGGPPGNVPEVSNERRPGLTYNTSVKGSAFNPEVEFVIQPVQWTGFERTASLNDVNWMRDGTRLVREGRVDPNYVGRMMRLELLETGASEKHAANVVKSWLEKEIFKMSEVTVDVNSLVLPEVLNPEDESANIVSEPDIPVEDWNLGQGRELRDETTELPQRITHVKKKELKFRASPDKKYSFIDPEAPELTDKDISETTEQSGPSGDQEIHRE